MKQQINADLHRFRKSTTQKNVIHKLLILSALICVNPLLLFSCSAKPTDMRSLAPADSLVYLETNDLAAALQPIIDSKPFNEVAKYKPDLSALKGVQLAVAVTGFETSEEKVDDEQVIGRIEPHFVAIADTHAWNFQAVGFAETKLGSFVEKIYDQSPTLEKTDKHGGKYFTWTALDGRKSYALVIDSLIYFANDESSIEKCLAVRHNEVDSIIKTGKVPNASQEILASGYVSTDGVAQIANIVGLQFASESSEDSEVQSAIAGIVPQLLRSSITEISWASTKTEHGIEDKYSISMPSDIADVFNKTMAPSASVDDSIREALPAELESVSVYKLKDPQIALRSLMLTAAKRTDPLVGEIIGEYVKETFDTLGIHDPEIFLSSIGTVVATARRHIDDEPIAIIAPLKDQKTTESALSDKTRPLLEPVPNSRVRGWDEDGESMSVVFEKSRVLIGYESIVDLCGTAAVHKRPTVTPELFRQNGSSVATIGKESVASEIADLLSEKKSEGVIAVSLYFSETFFTSAGIERKTTSDFGLIGSIIAQLAQD